MDADWKYIGVTVGGLGGTLIDNYSEVYRGLKASLPILGLRAGNTSRLWFEIVGYDHLPVGTPEPAVMFGIAFIDSRGTRYRFGGTDTGPYGEIRVLTKSGLEIGPFMSLQDADNYNLSFRITRRIPATPR